MDDTTNTANSTVTLTHPLPYGNGTLKEITFRKPKAGDLRGLKLAGLAEMDVDLILKIGGRLSIQAVTDAQLWELDPVDLLKVTEKVVGFFTDAVPSPTTPGTPGAS